MGFMSSYLLINNTRAELLALLHGLCIAYKYSFTPLGICMDSKVIISFIKSDHTMDANIIDECRELIHNPWDPPIQHSKWEANKQQMP